MRMMRKENYLIGMPNKWVLAFLISLGILGVCPISKKGPNDARSEPLQDPKGAYSQLIRFQELNKYPGKQEFYGDHEDTVAFGRHSSQILSPPSSDISESRLHSFQIAYATSDFKDLKETEYSYTPSNVSLVHLTYMNKPKIPAMINSVILPIFRYLLSAVIKSFFKLAHELRSDIEFWALMLLVLGLACLEVTPFRTYLFGVGVCKLIRRIQLKCFEKVVQMEIRWFDTTENSSGLIVTKLSTNAVSVINLVGNSLFQNTVSASFGLIIKFMRNWQLAFIVLVLLLLLGRNGNLQFKFLNGFNADTKKQYEEASEVASVAAGSIRTVASLHAEDNEKKCEGPRRAGIKQGLVSGAGFRSPMLFLLLELLRLSLVAMGVSQSGSFVPDSGKAKTVAASNFGLLDQNLKINLAKDFGIMLEIVKADIEFSHVSFKYPSRFHIQIFRDLCLDIHSGQTVALVGKSGGGKLMVVSLPQRIYDADLGQILFDRVDIQKLKVKWLRQQMGLVNPEPVLFDDTTKGFVPSQLSNFRLGDKPGLYGGGIDREYDMVIFIKLIGQ